MPASCRRGRSGWSSRSNCWSLMPYRRRSREGGNPVSFLAADLKTPGPRLRGDDDASAVTAAAPAVSRGRVEFANVSLAYDGQDAFAVEDITLSIAPGEFVAIVGPSGCGKSTFMKLATGLKPPTRGRVAVDGRPVTSPLKIVGMAFQAPTLLPWRTTLDNVLLPLEIVEPYRSRFRRERPQFAQRANALLATVGLAGYGEQFPWQLSGGM